MRPRLHRLLTVSLFVACAAAASAVAGIDARLMRYPDVSATQICFVHAGDIWVAPKGGVSRLDVEEIVSLGERVVMRWVYHWQDEHGAEGHIRGIDLYHLRDGRIAEKLSYVQG